MKYRNIGEHAYSNSEEKKGFQGLECMDDDYINEVKEYIATYLLYNAKFENVEARKEAINDAFAKICIFFEINDLPLNEENIADKQISAKLSDWLALSQKEIEEIIEENEPTKPLQSTATKEEKKIEEKPCKCHEHQQEKEAMKAKFEKMTAYECLPLAILGIGVAYLLFNTRFFYIAIGVIALIYFGNIAYQKRKDKQKEEEDE